MSGFWPDKREIAALLLLKEYFGYDIFNYGEAVDLLYPFYPERAVKNILRRLTKLGFLEKVGPLQYRVRPFEEVLRSHASLYLEGRLKRRWGKCIKVVGRDGLKYFVEGECAEKVKRSRAVEGPSDTSR